MPLKPIDHKHYVYFARDIKTGLIKIGTSANVPQRMYDLGIKFKTTMEVLGCVEGHFAKEKELHLMFWQHHKADEFFYPADELLQYINDQVPKGIPHEPDYAVKTATFKLATQDTSDLAKKLIELSGVDQSCVLSVVVKINHWVLE